MQPYTPREKSKIIAGAVAAVVIVGLMAIIALAFLLTPRSDTGTLNYFLTKPHSSR
jgi:hypothetical protein